MPELLSDYRLVHSTDIEEARQGMAEALDPHRLYPLAHGTVVSPTILNAAEVGSLSVSYLAHGVPVRVRCGGAAEPGEPYLVAVLPLAGGLVIRNGRNEIHADSEVAAVLDSDVHVDLSFETNTELVMVRFDRALLETQLARMLGRTPSSALRLHASLDVTEPAVRSLLSMVRMVCQDLDGPRGLSHESLREPTAQLIMSQLLTAVPHTASRDLAALAGLRSREVTPRVIRRAAQLIDEHAREDLTVGDIAEAVGISVRSLQAGFRRHLDTTPVARLREARLAGVRNALLAADPQRQSVSQLALEWGFVHQGRFARAYRQAFNESPSQTLRR